MVSLVKGAWLTMNGYCNCVVILSVIEAFQRCNVVPNISK